MSLHSAGYLAILEELKKDLPWIMRTWLKVFKPKMKTPSKQLVLNLEGPEVKLSDRESYDSSQKAVEHAVLQDEDGGFKVVPSILFPPDSSKK